MFQQTEIKTEAETVSVLAQIREGWQNKPAFITGVLIGGIMPVGAYLIGHHGLDSRPYHEQPMAYALGMTLGFSAKTVFEWGKQAFRKDFTKAAGLVVMLEMVMSFAPPALRWFSLVCLAYLVIINAVATACNFALADKTYKVKPKVRAIPKVKANSMTEQIPWYQAPSVTSQTVAPKRVRKPKLVSVQGP